MTLSQDQINAILEGTGTYMESKDPGLAEAQSRFYQQISEMAMEAGSVAVSQALGKTVVFSHPELQEVTSEALVKELSPHQVLIQTGYLIQQSYETLLLIKDYDVAVIFDILMGKDGRNPDLEIGDLQISAIGEVMNQLVGAAATTLSRELDQKIAMIPPESQLLNLEHDALPKTYQKVPLVQIRYQLVIEGVLDSEMYELRTLSSAQNFYQGVMGPPPAPPAPAAAPPMAAPAAQAPAYAPPPAAAYYAPPPMAAAPSGPPPLVHPAEFAPLNPFAGAAAPPNSLDRIMDIPLKATVELGSTRLKVKKVLDLTKGSVVELDKLSGDPVDLMVNGRLVAKGEVVVINENFGIRITEILGPADRLQHLAE